MKNKMSPVVHFEMPYEDKNRMAEFYTKVFGWRAQMLGADMGEYVVVETTERDPVTKFPKQPGRINGGFFEKSKGYDHSRVVIAVNDIKQAIKDVEAVGGKIVGGSKKGEPDDIPGIGLYIAIEDTEGNRVALLQPNPMM